ncbi:peroxiredoxin, OsmC subfamily [Saccharomonospora marina XMU15]|uniref:Peroxiredoxin, OsmC subfamily n=1 Tax=Saccharomonospora marina XMU15 TaxID=882083 RepID=H5X456_9PSEU|nr:OsmC family peroxiredoxin [Saccharomonospora marina]EHR53329.1 peroxiredoxin, OsmC subfamily [Saccharomonospora marina XMU15]
MASRDSTTNWKGGLNSGTGVVTLDSSGSARFEVTFPRRIGEPEGTTSPEELIAAAQSSCLAMNLAGTLEKEGLTPNTIDVSARVTVGPSNGGLSIDTVAITLSAEVAGVDEDTFARLAQQAKDTCPVSNALAGTTITLDARLAG